LAESGYWLFQIPTNARPKSTQVIVGFNVTTGRTYAFNVRPDGNIVNIEAIAQGNYYFDSTWII
jgi:hypothetical protein